MSDKPILFTTDMVRAILAGRKTCTRRCHGKPRYAVGDHLWGKERHRFQCRDAAGLHVEYYADGEVEACRPDLYPPGIDMNVFRDGRKVWRPSLFMPTWAARIWREVTGVRQERLQDISEADARAEGIEPYNNHVGLWVDYSGDREFTDLPIYSFATLWDSINGKRPGCSWDDNPLVYVYHFKELARA